ncbi:class I SAM-dependent methyltransferase [Cryptosporangium phraense]|uniref:Class I SAM-dependent methyltransferase n=1 Tax=Cryptosporangium phraense TaxID=2593070 RepID=A0A545AXF2_9ACTN|nr:class I SAM-dependent methyltransferase [Cryptosporangium phraense]TQS45988.1 class I SAM-dependent methyltransferase [Cryptosporangium phraense]
MADVWTSGNAYDAYVGRWSRRVAESFVAWLALPPGRRWLDVGCGTGALTAAVLEAAAPASVVGVDPSLGFLATARARLGRATFRQGDARALPLPSHSVDVVVSGLTLNFVPVPAVAAAEWRRVVTPGGTVAAYVWDYAEGMQMMRVFWDAAAALDPAAAAADEGPRFAICHPDALSDLWVATGFSDVRTRAIEVATDFADFDDFWGPFLGGQGPAPAYVASLDEPDRAALRDAVRARLPRGPIHLTARAWAVKGVR